ncbi:hypothetical protein [Desulfosarcina variabilis]|uniref:hypothetical protein n=1 Tax=Desulfosarcina variabilis TaxID=2300 RepID=UPI003AFA9A51
MKLDKQGRTDLAWNYTFFLPMLAFPYRSSELPQTVNVYSFNLFFGKQVWDSRGFKPTTAFFYPEMAIHFTMGVKR